MQLDSYRKALMGFDFASAVDLLDARREFRKYLASQGIPVEVADKEAAKLKRSWEFAAYAFCPTGEGGGVDNSCSPVNKGDTVEVDGKQRGVENSLGQNIHSTKEGVQNFYKWFGSSKITDDDNRPLIVYHGTGADFDEFDPKRTATSPRGSSGSLGFFFTGSTKEGSGYGTGYPEGGSVLPVYLSIQNPKKIERGSDLWDRVLNSRRDAKAVQTDLKKQGYDGAITPLGEYVAFSPTQIKSIFNKGKFDPKNPKINFSLDAIQNLGKSFMLHHMPPWRGLMDTRSGSPHMRIFKKYVELREKVYHLSGQHDQSTHGLWAEGRQGEALSKEASFLEGRAKEAEPRITADLKSAVGQKKLRGLDFRLKRPESLRRKMESLTKATGKSPTAVALGINDAVRYTAEFRPDEYAQKVRTSLVDLGRRGYKIERVKNYWEKGDDYDGINAVLRSPSGMKFEVQFHTAETSKVKDAAHKIYEKFRVATDSKEAKRLVVKMRSMWSRVGRPAGVMAVGALTTTGI